MITVNLYYTGSMVMHVNSPRKWKRVEPLTKYVQKKEMFVMSILSET